MGELSHEFEATRRVVLCGSMSFFGMMHRLQDQLARRQVATVLPDTENEIADTLSVDQYDALKREMSFNHIRRIKNPRTYGILVANFDKHGAPGYIGPSSFAEIAIAAAHGRKVFILNEFPSLYRDELTI